MAKNIKHFFAYETFKLLRLVYSIHLRLEVLNPTELHEEDSSRNASDDLAIKKWTLTEARRLEDEEGMCSIGMWLYRKYEEFKQHYISGWGT